MGGKSQKKMAGGGRRTLEKRNKQQAKKDSSENRNRTSDLKQTELKTENSTHRINNDFFH
jgi:hypothetical protein